MKPIYEENEETLEIAEQISCHIPPHLHKSMELVSVTEGTLEIGVGTELYHMEKGDFALVFPELIHHYQVFNSESCKAIYALASPLLAPSYTKELQQFCPVNPVILAQEVPPRRKLCPTKHAGLSSRFTRACSASGIYSDYTCTHSSLI